MTADRPTLPHVLSEVDALTELQESAASYRRQSIVALGALVRLDERLDGEPVVRIVLLLEDPADETWELDQVIELRRALGRRAAELGLPPVSLTLVAQSEPAARELFV